MASAARELEPDPLPSDLSNRAPIISDIERGYAKDETPYHDIERESVHGIHAVGGGGTTQSGGGGDHRDDENSKNEKTKGKGLTAGDDEMDAIPENNFWLVMPS